MEKKPIKKFIGITLLGVLILSVVWKFGMEQWLRGNYFWGLKPESLGDKLEFVLNSVFFSFLALLGAAFWISRRIAQHKVIKASLGESEEKFIQLANNIEDVFWITSFNFDQVFYVNPPYEKIWGKPAKKLLNNPKAWMDSIHPEDLPGIEQVIEEAIKSKQKILMDYRIIRPDGTVRWIHDEGFPIFDAHGKVARLVGIAKDVTERKQVEQLVKGQNRILEMVAQGSPLIKILNTLCSLIESQQEGLRASICLLDEAKKCLCFGAAPSLPDSYNEAVHGMAIGPEEGSCGTAAFKNELVIVEDISQDPLWRKFKGLALPHGLRSCWSMPIRNTHGRVLGTFALYHDRPHRPAESELNLIRTAAHIAGIAIQRKQAEKEVQKSHDELEIQVKKRTQALTKINRILKEEIVERTKVEDALRKSERNLGHAQKMAQLGNWVWDIQKNEFNWSDEIYRIFGLKPQELGATFEGMLDFVHPDDRSLVEKSVDNALFKNEPFRIEHGIVRPDGTPRIVQQRSEVFFDEKGKPIKMVGTIQDITERKKAENDLQESQRVLNTLISNLPGMVYRCLHDESWTLEYVSEGCFPLTGYRPEDLIGNRNVSFGDEVILPDDRERVGEEVEEALKEFKPFTCVYRILDAKGKKKWVWEQGRGIFSENGNLDFLEGFIIDITERKQAQEQIQAKSRQQAAIAKLGRYALAGFQNLMERSVELVAQTLEVEYCKILETHPNGNNFLLRAGVGWKEGLVGHATLSGGLDSQAGFTLDSAIPVIVDDLRSEKRFTGPPLLLDHGVVSGLSVIIQGGEKPFGVLGAHTRTRRRFTQDDVHFLQSIANLLAEVIEHQKAENALRESEARYQSLFEDSPISLWEEDFSEVKLYIESLKKTGVRDFREFFENNIGAVKHCVKLVKILDVNQATLVMYKANSKKDLVEGLSAIITEDSLGVFREELIAMAQGATKFESTVTQNTLTGERFEAFVSITLAPGFENTWRKVFVSVMDITQQQSLAEKLMLESEE